jgi:hypothetical protein
MTNLTWSAPPSPASLPPDHSATFHAWKALTEAQTGSGGGGDLTGALIDAVLTNKPTSGGPGQLATRHGRWGPGGSRPTKLMSGFGAAVATTAGKIVLCTAVAAASVGGVYATTDRIALPEPARAPEVAAVDLTEGAPPEVAAVPEPPTVSEMPAWLETPDIGAPLQVANDHGQDVVEFITGTDPNGCEFGQAVASVASQGAADNGQDGEQDHDPCNRADEKSEKGQNDRGGDETDEHPGRGGQGESSVPSGSDEGSGDGGRPDRPEKPDKDD